MKVLTQGIVAATAISLACGLVGCGSAASAAAHAPSSASAAPAPSTSASTATASASSNHAPSAAGAVTVKTAAVAVKGKTETVLTTPAGFTLYYFTHDTPRSSQCVGPCAAIWHPYTLTGTQVRAPQGLPGALSLVKDVHGEQVAYQGHLLYTFSGDKKPGQANGQGVLKEWYVATPTLAAATATAAGTAKATAYGGAGAAAKSASSGSGW